MTADAVLRASVADLPVPPLPDPSFVLPENLAGARVAVVTTAGLMRPGGAAWTHDDNRFRIFERREHDVLSGHVSMSFDRSGAIVDPDVVVPLHRLDEMVADGIIGSVNDRYVSFMGALRSMDLLAELVNETGPAAAAALRADGVDVVVLTPVCPACPRTVGVLGHVLEAAGLSTVVLASNAAITERVRPPRALVCDFPLGRPLGRPGDPAFQRRVLDAAFSLFDRPSGPVLEWFPDVIDDDADTPLTCPVPNAPEPRRTAAVGTSVAADPIVDEARAVRAAWERTRARLGRTHIGRQVDVDGIPAAIEQFVRLRDGTPWREEFADTDVLLQTAMDIRMYYEEAALGLVDDADVPAAHRTEAWFYRRTRAGALLRDVVAVLQATGQDVDLGLAGVFYLVPLSQVEGDREHPPWRLEQTEIQSDD